MLISFLLVTISAIVCAMTNHFIVFMIFRFIQAIGAGMVPLITIHMISQLYKGEARGDAMGTYQILLTLAPALASIFGGVLGEYFRYQGVFFFLFVFSTLLLLLAIYTFLMKLNLISKKSNKDFYKSIEVFFLTSWGLQ